MNELFVYWRCNRVATQQAQTAIAEMQRRLRALHPGLATRLHRRADGDEPLATLMESYAGVDIGPAIQASIAAAARETLHAWCVGERHAELFTELFTELSVAL